MKRLGNLLLDTESLVIFAVIISLTFITAWIVNRYFQKQIIKRSKEQNTNLTSFLFLKHMIIAIIYLFGIGWGLLILPISKNFAHSLLAGAGASTIIIGFASQQVLSNMISGIFIIINKPFIINDIIEIQGNKGKVVEITLHDTIIESEKNEKIIIPNSMISNSIIKNTIRP